MNMRKTILLLTATAVCMAVKAETITISTAADLAAVATNVNSGANTYSGDIIKLGADLDLSGYAAWTPIGINVTGKRFEGIFDGNHHIISNLKVNASATGTGYVAGLFGMIGASGVVKDLTVTSLTVQITKDGSGDTDWTCSIGAIAGQNKGLIVGCANRGVTVYGNWNGALVGGIVGWNMKVKVAEPDTYETGRVKNCYNLGRVYSGESYTGDHLGGIVGQNDGEVENCFVRNTADSSTDRPIYGNQGSGATMTGCFYMNGSADDGIVSFTLNNSTDNDLSGVIGQRNVLLKDRTIFSDGAWNTLCLPFDIPAGTTGYSPIAGADVRGLESASFSSGVLTLNFSDVTSIEAGKPYIVRWQSAITENLSNPVFLGVNVSNYTPSAISKDLGGGKSITFEGSYSPVSIGGEDKSILYLGDANTLYYPSKAMTIGSCRAILRLSGFEAGDPVGGVKAFALNFDGEENDADGIGSIQNSKFKIQNEENAWYDLSGRKMVNGKMVNGKLPRGIYIHGGRKVVIK